MKRFFLAVLAFSMPSLGLCVNFNELAFRPSKYTVTHSTVSISSVTAYSIAPQTGGNYLNVEISSSTGRYFYRRDGLTTNVTSYGTPVSVGSSLSVQGFYPVTIQLAPGHAAQELRVITIEPVR